jgi:hypothetical protein
LPFLWPKVKEKTMICHCSSDAEHASRNYTDGYSGYTTVTTPDPNQYKILDAVTVNSHLVMKVQYPNVKSCPFDGTKVMVFLNTTPLAALKWKKIDPHFREKLVPSYEDAAPSPAARFPASKKGWEDAIEYAKRA